MNRWSLGHVLKSCQTPGLLGNWERICLKCHCTVSVPGVALAGPGNIYFLSPLTLALVMLTLRLPIPMLLMKSKHKRGHMEAWSTVPASVVSHSEVSWTSSSCFWDTFRTSLDNGLQPYMKLEQECPAEVNLQNHRDDNRT